MEDKNLNPNPLIVLFLLNFSGETDSRHNPITKFLGNDIFISVSIDLNNLIKSIDHRIPRWHFTQLGPIREKVFSICGFQILKRNVKYSSKILQICGLNNYYGLSLMDWYAWFGLGVEYCGHGDFIAAQFFGDLFEAEKLE